jgi:hypothetical protein
MSLPGCTSREQRTPVAAEKLGLSPLAISMTGWW